MDTSVHKKSIFYSAIGAIPFTLVNSTWFRVNKIVKYHFQRTLIVDLLSLKVSLIYEAKVLCKYAQIKYGKREVSQEQNHATFVTNVTFSSSSQGL